MGGYLDRPDIFNPLNQLDRPICYPKGSGCCCGSCTVRSVNCGEAREGGGFGGSCCSCIPKRMCASLWIDGAVVASDCSCLDEDEYNDGLSAVAAVQSLFNCTLSGWSGVLQCPNANWPPIDFQIGYEQEFPPETIDGVPGYGGFNSSDCYVVLASTCLGYGVDSYGYDTRVWIPLGGEYHDNDVRKANCQTAVFEFPIDLSGCSYGAETACTNATLKISPHPHISRPLKTTGEWNGYDVCSFQRICITLNDGYTETTINVCIDDLDTYDYHGEIETGWTADFGAVEGAENFEIIIVRRSETEVSLRTKSTDSYGSVTLYEDDYLKLPDCPDFTESWELYSGSTISIRGDKKADCTDCRCWCDKICVELVIGDDTYRETLEWDDYQGGWGGDLANTLDPTYATHTVALDLFCDECDGFTYLTLQDGNSNTPRVRVDCSDLEASITYAYDSETEARLTVTCEKCVPCFTPGGDVIVPCCPDDPVPASLVGTIFPDEGDFDPGPPELAGDGDCSTADGVVTLIRREGDQIGGGFYIFDGSCFPFPDCPDVEVFFYLECVDEYTGWRLYTSSPNNLQFDGDPWGVHVSSCSPLSLEFTGIFTGASRECCGDGPDQQFRNVWKIVITE